MYTSDTLTLIIMIATAWYGLAEAQFKVSTIGRRIALVSTVQFLGLVARFDATTVYGGIFGSLLFLSAVALVCRAYFPFREQAKALAAVAANHAADLLDKEALWKAESMDLLARLEREHKWEVSHLVRDQKNEIARINHRHKEDLEEQDQALAKAKCDGYLDLLARIGELEDLLESERSARQAIALSNEAREHERQPAELSAGQSDRVSKLESELQDASNTLVLERAQADSQQRALSSQVTSLTTQLETARAGDVSKSTLEAAFAERDEARRMLASHQILAQQSSNSASAEIVAMKQQLEQNSSELAHIRSLGQQLEIEHQAALSRNEALQAACEQLQAAESNQKHSTAEAEQAEILSLKIRLQQASTELEALPAKLKAEHSKNIGILLTSDRHQHKRQWKAEREAFRSELGGLLDAANVQLTSNEDDEVAVEQAAGGGVKEEIEVSKRLEKLSAECQRLRARVAMFETRSRTDAGFDGSQHDDPDNEEEEEEEEVAGSQDGSSSDLSDAPGSEAS